MAQSPFRYRGVQVLIDTVASAEFDIQLYSIASEAVDRIGAALRRLPHASTDRAVGGFLIREIEGFDVVWIVGREDRDVVVTIGRIRPPDPGHPIEDILRNLNVVAIFRGATGI